MSMCTFQAVGYRLNTLLERKSVNQRFTDTKAKLNEQEASFKEYAGQEADEALASFFMTFDPVQRQKEVIEQQKYAHKMVKAHDGQNNFGECMDCGQDIQYKPFTIYSHAKRCLHCQAIHERIYSGRAGG